MSDIKEITFNNKLNPSEKNLPVPASINDGFMSDDKIRPEIKDKINSMFETNVREAVIVGSTNQLALPSSNNEIKAKIVNYSIFSETESFSNALPPPQIPTNSSLPLNNQNINNNISQHKKEMSFTQKINPFRNEFPPQVQLENPEKSVFSLSSVDTNADVDRSIVQLNGSRYPTHKISQITRRIGTINPTYSFFPKFYKRELKRALFLSVFWITVAIITFIVGLISSTIVIKLKLSVVDVLVPFASVLGIIASASCMILYSIRYKLFHNEATVVNFKDSKVITINVVKIYKISKVANIKANWMCGLAYLLSSFGILMLMIISAILKDNFLYAWNAANNSYFWSLIIFIAAIIIAIGSHIYITLGNYFRAASIENFYGMYIVPTNEIDLLRKKVNRKYMIIFIVIGLLAFWIGWMAYKAAKKAVPAFNHGSKKTTISVA